MSVQPQVFEQQGACVRLVALYRNARQPIRRLTNVLTLLGRGDNCDLILSSASVGVAHAAIVRLGTSAYVCDLGAPGGTQVDGRSIRWARLRDTAELVLGRFRFRVELEGEAALASESPAFSLLREGEVVATTVEDPILLIGSAEGCDVLNQDEGVAGRHALVVWTHHGPILRDLSTQTGTRHNGRRIVVARLMPGDTVGVGRHDLTFQIDMRHFAGSEADLLASSSASIDTLVAARLGDDQNTEIDDLFPPTPSRMDEKSARAETQRDLSLLNDASRSISDASARLESSFDGSTILAGFDQTTSGTMGALMTAQGSATGASKPSDSEGGDRARDTLLESTMRLQSRRDEDKRRGFRPSPRDESTTGVTAAPPWTQGTDDSGTQADVPTGVAGATGPIDEMPRPDQSPALPRAEGEDAVREMVWQKTAARLELELAEAREELKRAKQKYAQHMELHGTIEARNRKLDQRIAELRARVAGAQEAMDERARTLRTGLEAERERLRLQHLDIQRKNEELDSLHSRRKDEVQKTFTDERAALDEARAELQAERDAYETLRDEFEAKVQQDRAEQDRALAEREAEHQKRLAELDERRREIERAAAEDDQRREAAFGWRENELAERRRQLELEAEAAARAREEARAADRAATDDEVKAANRVLVEELERREVELRTRESKLEIRQREASAAIERARQTDEETVVARQQALEQAFRLRVKEFEERYGAREKEIDQRRQELERQTVEMAAQREAEVQARLRELERGLAEGESKRIDEYRQRELALDERRAELERQAIELAAQREAEMQARLRELQTGLAEVDAKRLDEHRQREAVIEQRRVAARALMERQISEREAEFRNREEELSRREQQIENRLRELEESARQAALAVDEQVAARRAELEASARAEFGAREAEIVTRQREIDERMRELDEATRQTARWAEQHLESRRKELEEAAVADLGRRRSELEQSMNARLADGELELAARDSEYRSKMESVAQREAELERIAEHFRSREGQLEQRHAALDERERDLLRKVDRHAQRETELSQSAAGFESRNARLVEWQTRLESERAVIEVERDEAEKSRAAILLRQQEIDQRAAELEARFAELLSGHTGLRTERELLDGRAVEVESREVQLRRREEALERSREELAEDERRVNEAREEVRALEEKRKLLEQRGEELTALSVTLAEREHLLEERVSTHDQHAGEFDRARREADELRIRLDVDRRELEDKARKIDERMARTEVAEQRTRDAKARLDQERDELEALRSALASQSESVAEQSRDLARRAATLETELNATRAERERTTERQSELDREKAQTAAALDRITAERTALELVQTQVREQQEAFAREQAAFEAKVSALDSERARLERDKLLHRDRDRDLSGDRQALGAAEAELERLQAELKKGIDENHVMKRHLQDTRDRLRSRKTRLLQDVAKIDERQQQLDADLEQARKLRARLDADREALVDDRRKLEMERDAHGEQAQGLNQTQRTYVAGLREVEAREKVAAQRELELAEHARKLEEYRIRLEEEYGDIEQQRKQLLDAKEKGGAESQRVAVLIEQAETQRQELRGREEQLDALEKALAARSAEVGRTEEETRRKIAEFDERLARIEDARRELERDRTALTESIETQRDDVETQRRQAETEIAAQQSELERRMRVFETEMAAQREALEAEERVRDNAFAEELRGKVEAEMTDRLESARRREQEIEERCKHRLEEVERDIQERLGRFEEDIRRQRETAEESITARVSESSRQSRDAQTRWESKLEELRTRQEDLAQEHARIKEQREGLDAQRRELETQRREFALERARARHEPADHSEVDTTADARHLELEERERQLEERAVRLEATQAAWERMRSSQAGRHESISADFPGEDVGAMSVRSARLADPRAALLGEADAEALTLPTARRTRVAAPAAFAIGLGLVFGVLVYKMLPAAPRFEQAFVKLDGTAPASMIDLDRHSKVIADSLKDASGIAGENLIDKRADGTLKIEPDGKNGGIWIRAVSDANPERVHGWLKAIDTAYRNSLEREAKSQKEVNGRLAELGSQRQEKRSQRDAAARKLAEYQKAMDTDPQVAAVERTQEELKRELDAANKAVTDARAALDGAQAKPVSDAPITPSEAQRRAAYAQDAELTQAMAQQAMFARDFHAQLVKGVDASLPLLSSLQTAIDQFGAQIDDQRKDQKTKEILLQLEEVAVGVSDLRDLTQKLGESMGELAPKIRKWQDGSDSDLLLEYQSQAEDLIRKFFAASDATVKQIRKDISEIGKGGSEPTQRSIIQRTLEKSVYDTAVAIRDFVGEAVAVVRANNKELLALQRGMTDEARNIKQKQDQHEEALVQHLQAAQSDERSAAITKLQGELDEAIKRKDAASAAFVNRVQEAIASDRAATDRVRNLRKQYGEQNAQLRTLEQELARLDAENVQIETDGRTALAGVAKTQLDPTAGAGSRGLDRSRVGRAGGVGVAAALLFFGSFMWLTSPRQRRS